MKFAQVIVDISASEVDRIFDYFAIEGSSIGCRVLVPFGKMQVEGFIIGLKDSSECPIDKIKPIIKLLDETPVILPELLELKDFLADRYGLRTVDIIRLFIPSHMRKGRIKALTRQVVGVTKEFREVPIDIIIKPHSLAQREIFLHLLENGEQLKSILSSSHSVSAMNNLIARGILYCEDREVGRVPYQGLGVRGEGREGGLVYTSEQQKAIEAAVSGENGRFILHGVTGSGKTEVYMAIIASVLAKGETAVMLVPEIGLTPQVLKNFRARFSDSVAILHSGLSAGERFDEWRRLLTGEAKIAVGARSAIFAPLKNIGCIIIDEEHDASYVSDSNPRYDTHLVAEFRAGFNKANLILGSATPSIETYHKVKTGEYKLLEMKERVNKKSLPEIKIVDMCREFIDGNNSFLSRELAQKLDDCIAGGNQAMLFLNRRGYSSYLICKSCSHVPKCERCSVSLVYHREDDILKCHYCTNRYANLSCCPECKSPHIRGGNIGTEQVTLALKKRYPTAKILRMDFDTTKTKDAHANILSEFSKDGQILVGTQMIAKGHDFPNVTLVGILDADLSLYFTDYRSIERTFQLATQVAGRAGRENKVGEVILQSYTPKHFVYKYIKEHNYSEFFEKEYNLRKVTKYPPFSRVVRILVSSENEELAGEVLKKIFEEIQSLQKQSTDSFYYLAAMRSPIKKIEGKARMQIIIRLINDPSEQMKKIFPIVSRFNSSKVSIFVSQNPTSLS